MLKALKNWFKENGREAAQARAHERARMGLEKINAVIDEYEKEKSLTKKEDDENELAKRILRVLDDEMKKYSSPCCLSYTYPDIYPVNAKQYQSKKISHEGYF
jgi:hypothetical protein